MNIYSNDALKLKEGKWFSIPSKLGENLQCGIFESQLHASSS